MVTSFNCIGQDIDNCHLDDLNFGTFDSYENGEKVGVIYRYNNFQIEKALDKDNYNASKYYIKNCAFYIRSNKIVSDIDTITMQVLYTKIKPRHYSFIAKPIYLNIDYQYKGEIIKISDSVNNYILDELKKIINIQSQE